MKTILLSACAAVLIATVASAAFAGQFTMSDNGPSGAIIGAGDSRYYDDNGYNGNDYQSQGYGDDDSDYSYDNRARQPGLLATRVTATRAMAIRATATRVTAIRAMAIGDGNRLRQPRLRQRLREWLRQLRRHAAVCDRALSAPERLQLHLAAGAELAGSISSRRAIPTAAR